MESLTQSQLEEKLEKLELLMRIGTALSAERSKDRLIEMILLEAKALCNADGGTLYLRSEDTLRFAILRSDSLGIALGGSTGKPVTLPLLPLHDPLTGEPNRSNVATCAALLKESVNIPHTYSISTAFDFSATKAFYVHNK